LCERFYEKNRIRVVLSFLGIFVSFEEEGKIEGLFKGISRRLAILF